MNTMTRVPLRASDYPAMDTPVEYEKTSRGAHFLGGSFS